MAISQCKVHTNTRSMETTPHGDPAFPFACYEDDMRIVNVPVHWHDDYEFIIGAKGKVTLYLNTDRVEIGAGDVVFINSGCMHSVKSISNGESVLFSLTAMPRLVCGTNDSVFSEKLTLPLGDSKAPRYVVMNEHVQWQCAIREQLLTAWQAVKEETYDFENEARYRFTLALHLLVDHTQATSALRKRGDLCSERMKILLTYIDSHYPEQITNGDLMSIGACSESVLLRNFKQITGCTPVQYILNYRIGKAADMLLTTGKHVQEIAEACGFADVSYFTKVFHRSKAVSPIEYRKMFTLRDGADV